jgi:hypothetical protein
MLPTPSLRTPSLIKLELKLEYNEIGATSKKCPNVGRNGLTSAQKARTPSKITSIYRDKSQHLPYRRNTSSELPWLLIFLGFRVSSRKRFSVLLTKVKIQAQTVQMLMQGARKSSARRTLKT